MSNTEKIRQEVINIGDTINGEINRICVTNDIEELNSMYSYALRNLEKLYGIRYLQLRDKETK